MQIAALLLLLVPVIDPQTGLWFPPYAKPADYLEMKASYAKDAKRAFEADPQLMRDVCTAMFGPGAAERAIPQNRAGQFAVQLHMLCSAMTYEQQQKPERERVAQEVKLTLDKMFDDAEAAAMRIPAAERSMRQDAIVVNIDDAASEKEWLENVLLAIALRPRDPRAAHLLLTPYADVLTVDERTTFTRKTLAEFAESLYRERSDRPEWKNGFPEVLLYRGKLEEARAAQKELVLDRDADLPYDRFALAVMNEMAGEKDAFAELVSICGERCWDVVYGVTVRTLQALGKNAPPRTADMLIEVSRHSSDPARKVRIARELTKFDPKLAERENLLIATSTDMPGGAVNDAVRALADATFKAGNGLRAMAFLDCWIAHRWGGFEPFPQDGWRRISTMLRTPDDRTEKECTEDPNAELCVYRALLTRLHWSVQLGRRDLARQTLEMIGSRILAGRMKATRIPESLLTMAIELRDFDPQSGADQIAAYVAAQPHDQTSAHNLKSFPRVHSIVALEPFASPTAVSDLPTVCRDGRVVQ